MTKVNIVIADDHKMFREGLKELLAKEDKLNIITDAGSAKEIKEALNTDQVDLILMDIDMGSENGIDITRELKSEYPNLKVLAVSMHEDKNYIVKMMEAGANGYILKNAGKEEMMNAIQTVANGNTYLSNQVSTKLMEHIISPGKKVGNAGSIPLTDREMEVLQLIAEEMSNVEIAEKLFISVRTVDTHRRNLLDKLGVKNTVGLIKYAIKHDLLSNN